MTETDFLNYYRRLQMSDGCLEYFRELFFGKAHSAFDGCYSELKSMLSEDAEKSSEYFRSIANRLSIEPDTFLAMIFLRIGYDTGGIYREKGIPERVFADTVGELPQTIEYYYEQNGRYGLAEDQLHWLALHITGRLFRLGRLQFEMMEFDTECELLPRGAHVLMVHIPSESPLSREACLESYSAARNFFPKYLGFKFDAFVCYSWLLSPIIREIVGENSNIHRFASDFYIFENYPDRSDDAIEFIFESETPYPQNTRLQIEAKKSLDKGLGLGESYGIFLNRSEKVNNC